MDRLSKRKEEWMQHFGWRFVMVSPTEWEWRKFNENGAEVARDFDSVYATDLQAATTYAQAEMFSAESKHIIKECARVERTWSRPLEEELNIVPDAPRCQSKSMSLAETCLSTGIGFVVAMGTQLVVFPFFGFHTTHTDNFLIASIFTVVSIIRGYFVRRLFNHIHRRAN